MIKELHEKLINGEITSVELTEQYFDAIEKKDKEIFAYLTLTKDLALEQAKKVDEKIAKGEKIEILEGIPGGVKDVICMKGVRTTAGSKILDNYIAPYDATVVKKLKETGAVILGKTNCDEFAMGSSTENSAYGPTKNPHDTTRVPGGTSGGSAAAIASNMAAWTLGSDTGGSCRQPASLCGVVGFKPTYGRVSRYGLIAAASSFDQIGTLTHSAEDAAIVLSSIAGRDKYDATSGDSFDKNFEGYLTGEIKGLKIGVVGEYLRNLMPEIRKIMEEVIDKYKRLGAKIVEIEMPYNKYALPAYYIIQPSEVSSNLARFDGVKYGMRINDNEETNAENLDALPRTLLEAYLDTRRYGLGAESKRRIMLGTYALSAGYYDAYYKRAQKVRTLIKKDYERVFAEVDVVLTPTTTAPAFKIGEKMDDPLQMYLEDIFTVTANITGVPAISVPCKDKVKVDDSPAGELPIGFQLFGKWFDEENLLRAADAYERNRDTE
jgi:aspartyl-tRNA(Asn)/glutamyl-tRNA(Gln) amidotransferase subunit A